MKECQLCKNCYTDDLNVCPKDGMPTMHTISGEPVLEGKYHLECRLGQGGMGVVYKARHAYLKTSHAIKIILPDLVGNDPQLVTRFRQEALAAAAIRHPNVVGVSDYGVANGTMPFLVMEYVEGESLHDLLAREEKLSPEKTAELMAAICAGVGAAHSQGIVHRDLKPLNVMICKDKPNMSEAVKILDFGLAKIKSGELLGSFIQAQTTGLMGSPYYMAPEQWSDEEPDARSDIYSLGVMIYQMIAGDVPFKGSSIPAIMKKHLSDEVPPLSDFGVEIAPQIEMAIRHTLEKEPENRTQSVEQMVGEFRNAVTSTASSLRASGYLSQSALSVTSLRILTNPAHSQVFIDDFHAGESRADGWILLEGVRHGEHRLRIKHEGFLDYEQDFSCDGSPLELFAQLPKDVGAIPKPILATMPAVNLPSQSLPSQSLPANTPANLSETHNLVPQTTGRWQKESQNVSVAAQPKKAAFSPLILAIIGISGLFLLTAIGVGAGFMLGFFGGNGQDGKIAPTPKVSPGVTPAMPIQAEMIKIPGGKFTMGRNDGEILEKPEYKAEVKDFWMDKTEVTNAEYANFIQETSYTPIPTHWENGKPVTGQENMPVRFVNINDINAFIEWRSKRDKVTYRLPTEEEWEYAASNGSDENWYPWGNDWKEERVVIDRNYIFAAVGSKPEGANKWGVLDLTGNVWEWTSSKAVAYKGTAPEVVQQINNNFKDNYVIRGLFNTKKEISTATATIRAFEHSEDRSNKVIGFRLVRSD